MEIKKEPFLARIISVILHPLLMPTYGVCLLFMYTNFRYFFAGQFLRFLIPIACLSFIFPGSGIYVLYKLKLIKDLELRNRKERFAPFFIAIFCYGYMFYYFLHGGMLTWFLATLLAPLLLLVISTAITLFWKISAHMMGIGGLLGSVLSVCYNINAINPWSLFCILFILAGSLGMSRLILNRHTPGQVYAGFLLGFIISYCCVWGSLWLTPIIKI